jgi:hypothetical protein
VTALRALLWKLRLRAFVFYRRFALRQKMRQLSREQDRLRLLRASVRRMPLHNEWLN